MPMQIHQANQMARKDEVYKKKGSAVQKEKEQEFVSNVNMQKTGRVEPSFPQPSVRHGPGILILLNRHALRGFGFLLTAKSIPATQTLCHTTLYWLWNKSVAD